jgi:hypothetical protein
MLVFCFRVLRRPPICGARLPATSPSQQPSYTYNTTSSVFFCGHRSRSSVLRDQKLRRLNPIAAGLGLQVYRVTTSPCRPRSSVRDASEWNGSARSHLSVLGRQFATHGTRAQPSSVRGDNTQDLYRSCNRTIFRTVRLAARTRTTHTGSTCSSSASSKPI